jgi:hypothetical protein
MGGVLDGFIAVLGALVNKETDESSPVGWSPWGQVKHFGA